MPAPIVKCLSKWKAGEMNYRAGETFFPPDCLETMKEYQRNIEARKKLGSDMMQKYSSHSDF